MKRILTSLFLLIASCVYGSGEGGSEQAEVIRKTGEATAGLQLSVEFGKEDYRIGEKIKMTIILKNVGEEEARVVKRTSFCTFDVGLRFADGPPAGTFTKKEDDRVPLTLFGQVDRNFASYKRSQLKLSPQQEYRAELEISRLFDLSLSGRYEVTVSKRLPADSGQERAVTVPSLVLTVEE